MSYQCIECGEISTSDEWNKATNKEYEDNTALLPESFIEVEGVDTVDKMWERINTKNYESNIDLPCFVCPKCDFHPMCDELIKAQ